MSVSISSYFRGSRVGGKSSHIFRLRTHPSFHSSCSGLLPKGRSISATMSSVSSDQPLNRLAGNDSSGLSIVHGRRDVSLKNLDLGSLIRAQSKLLRKRQAVIAPYPKSLTRWTYGELEENSDTLAKALLSMGVSKGDRVGIFSGNRLEYCALVFAAGRIGAILVVLNATYTPHELHRALKHTGTDLAPNFIVA
ncbi:hypothetical protein F4803DRAFT_250868 [Xylaria telfairii]|nr:hypothetical protein F4803DRAFT_250868 [Xylaria telfairii]